MFEEINLIQQLKNIDQAVFVLPNGLFTMDNQYIRHSDRIVKQLNFPAGTCLAVNNRNLSVLKGFRAQDIFQEKVLYQSGSFESVGVRGLTLDLILRDIDKMCYDIKKNPYENYLEITVIKMMMESLNNSKAMLGGVWTPSRVIVGHQSKAMTSFASFAKNIDDKNSIVAYLREKILLYPEILVDFVAEYRPASFSKDHSQYSTFLEYRILQVRYKIVLQEICLHSYYLTDKDKQKYDGEINHLKELMAGYPSVNIEEKSSAVQQ